MYKYELETHGHVWKLNKYDDEVDIFAFFIDIHNGPVCVKCGYGFCHHCHDVPQQECTGVPEAQRETE